MARDDSTGAPGNAGTGRAEEGDGMQDLADLEERFEKALAALGGGGADTADTDALTTLAGDVSADARTSLAAAAMLMPFSFACATLERRM